MKLSVRVTPRASRDAVEEMDMDGTLHVRVTAAPADGQANEAVRRLLAKRLTLAPRDVVLISGATSRMKIFELPLNGAEIRKRLAHE